MFKKIVSNLSFSPAVAGQLTFYAKRLRKENVTRGLGVLFGIGVFVLQFANWVAPPTGANASGPSDIMPGGFVNQQDMVDTCRSNSFISTVYGYFGITCDNIAGGSFQYIPAANSTWYSLGRDRHAASDQLIQIGDNSFYLRPLASVAYSSTGRAIVGTSSWGHPFAILLSCGNPVIPSLPTPPQPPAPPPPPPPLTPPSLVIHKVADNGFPAANSTVAPGAVIGYRLPFGNSGQKGALSAQIIDTLPKGVTYVSQSSRANNFQVPSASSPAIWTFNSLAGGAIDNAYLQVQVNGDVADGTKLCNQAIFRAVYVPTVTSETVCHTVKRTTPPPPTTANIHQSKFAVYLTRTQPSQQPVNANKTTAKAGEIIEYTLKTSNTGDSDKKNYSIIEDVADILEYADVTNAGGGTLQGKTLSWPATTIPGRTTVTKTFQVTVKTPVPSTVRSSSDPFSFDLCMDNVYGDTVQVCVEAPPVKQIETTSQALPQTGPGTGIGIVAGFFALMVFFYMRNRQLQTEVQILRVDNRPGV